SVARGPRRGSGRAVRRPPRMGAKPEAPGEPVVVRPVISEVTAGALLREGRAALDVAGVEAPTRDAEWLLAAVLGVDRLSLYPESGRDVPREGAARSGALVERGATREPLQHLTEFEEFHGLQLAVNPDVLIPRQETEGLVRWALEVLADEPAPMAVDLGTG